MIPSYSYYIENFVRGRGKQNPPAPGEHHFVAAYLVPKLYSIEAAVPDFINPDGTKAILGDVVYYKDGKHHFGIEAKLGTIRLTKREFNKWIVAVNGDFWPNLFIGVGKNGIAIAAWDDFRRGYIAAVQAKDSDWSPVEIDGGYGPMKSVDLLRSHLPPAAWFPFAGQNNDDAKELDARFTDALRRSIWG